MKRIAIFILVGLLQSGIFLAAEVVSAEVEAWNRASFTGRVTENMECSFESDTKSAGRISKDHTAKMVISGMPHCTVTSIQAWMHSNKTGGAGTLEIYIDESLCLSKSGSFRKWTAKGFTTEDIAISATGNWDVDKNGKVTLLITASENSLYLQKLTITYEQLPAVPYCVTFSENGQVNTEMMCEEKATEGVVLPSAIDEDIEGWEFAGWSEKEIISSETEPVCLLPGSRYYPQEDVTLQAIYRTKGKKILVQDTLFQSGEYLLAQLWSYGQYWQMSGNVHGGKVDAEACRVVQGEDGLYRMQVNYVDANHRYRMVVSGDSATLEHVATRTGVGYSKTALSTSIRKWKVVVWPNHSLLLVDDATKEIAKRLRLDGEPDAPEFVYKSVAMASPAEALLAFNVQDMPTTPQKVLWTTHPTASSVEQVQLIGNKNKIWHNGHIVIVREGKYYDINGRIER